MAIDRIQAQFKPIDFIQGLPKTESLQPKDVQPSKGTNFGEILSNAVGEVNNLQIEADKKIEGLTTGSSDVTTHEAMIALEKADVAFELMNQLRSKIIRAYGEVMRTQV